MPIGTTKELKLLSLEGGKELHKLLDEVHTRLIGVCSLLTCMQAAEQMEELRELPNAVRVVTGMVRTFYQEVEDAQTNLWHVLPHNAL